MLRVTAALVACAAFGAGAGPFATSAGADDYADTTGLVYIRIHAGWPEWGMHEDLSYGPFIWLDFIDITFPP